VSDAAVAALIDKQAISDVVLSYCRGIDRLDLDLVRACFHPDATDHHGSFSGTVDEFIHWVGGLLDSYDMTFHCVGNLLIELDGDRARAETYGVAAHRRAGGEDRNNLTTGFRYIDDFERRTDRQWRIARRVAVTEWSRVDRQSDWWPVPKTFEHGRRDRSDALYRDR